MGKFSNQWLRIHRLMKFRYLWNMCMKPWVRKSTSLCPAICLGCFLAVAAQSFPFQCTSCRSSILNREGSNSTAWTYFCKCGQCGLSTNWQIQMVFSDSAIWIKGWCNRYHRWQSPMKSCLFIQLLFSALYLLHLVYTSGDFVLNDWDYFKWLEQWQSLVL